MAREFSRTERIAQQIHKEVASIVQNEYKHRVGDSVGDTPLITLSGVEVSRDLAHAKVYVTCYSDSEEQVKSQIKQLNDYKGFIRGILAKRIRMRAVPALHFFRDQTITEGMRISNLVSQTVAEDEKRKQDQDPK